jgi:hypothetical protein
VGLILPTTPQLDRVFELLMTLDMQDENNLLILEQEIAMLDDEELSNLLKIGKKYKKTLEYFYERLVQEQRLRKQGAY